MMSSSPSMWSQLLWENSQFSGRKSLEWKLEFPLLFSILKTLPLREGRINHFSFEKKTCFFDLEFLLSEEWFCWLLPWEIETALGVLDLMYLLPFIPDTHFITDKNLKWLLSPENVEQTLPFDKRERRKINGRYIKGLGLTRVWSKQHVSASCCHNRAV